MSIMDRLREEKAKFKQRRKEAAAKRAAYDANPELELRDLRAEKRVLQTRQAVATERQQLKELRKAERKDNIRQVVGFFAAPTVKAAKAKGRSVPASGPKPMSSVFELGSRDKEDRYAIGGGKVRDGVTLGGVSQNKAFGLGEKKRRGPFA